MTSTYTKDEFKNIYNEYYNEILAYCFEQSGGRANAQELADHVFIKAWEQVIGGGDVANIRTFLFEIAEELVKEKVHLYRNLMAFSILSSNRILHHGFAS